MIDHLKSKNITLKCIYECSDNCPSQYKSRIPFRSFSKSTIPIMHNYFCEKHGKSAADGLIGRTNQFLYTAVSAKKEDLPDAASLSTDSASKIGKKRMKLMLASTVKGISS